MPRVGIWESRMWYLLLAFCMLYDTTNLTSSNPARMSRLGKQSRNVVDRRNTTPLLAFMEHAL